MSLRLAENQVKCTFYLFQNKIHIIAERIFEFGLSRRKFSLQSRSTKYNNLLQGTFRLVSSEGYENYLRSVGCGPLSLNMVLRSACVIAIERVSCKERKNKRRVIFMEDHIPKRTFR